MAIRLDRSANWLVSASFLTRMLEGVDLAAAMALVRDYDQQLDHELKIAQAHSANEAMMIAIAIAQASQRIKPELKRQLQTVYESKGLSADLLAGDVLDEESTKAVADAGRQMAKSRLHIGEDEQFSAVEKSLLKAYYRTIRLLVDCLYSDGSMLSPSRRQAIEQALFMPQDLCRKLC